MKALVISIATQKMRMVWVPLLMALQIGTAGCQTEFINAKPARELNPPPPEGNLYAGWRVFQDKCASCHGVAATGGERAPDLLPVVSDMSARRFAALVLQRYDLGNGLAEGSKNQSTVDTRIDDILRRGEPPIEMPGWQGEPAVNAHILDLHAYLTARANGKLGTERPRP
ncbi:MAG: hypothetical protein EBV64_10365 [Oxalobacteraceae bacterium]|jgi:cytochrome c2|nr:hypothetical protein [Oxalobacteraceae bacterium]